MFFNYRLTQYTILCLQDTHFTCYMENKWGNEVCFNSFKSRGAAIFFNNNFECKLHEKFIMIFGNFVVLDPSIQSHRLNLIKVYDSNEYTPLFYEEFLEDSSKTSEEVISEVGKTDIKVVGAFNLIMDPDMD